MPKFVIERNIPGAGSLSTDELHAISKKSNEVLADMAPEAFFADQAMISAVVGTRPQTLKRTP